MKKCTKCQLVKPLDDFHRFNASRDGRRAECKKCHCAHAQASYAKTRDAKWDVGWLRLKCRNCGTPFEYKKTTGQRRFYCGDDCRYRAGQDAKKARAATTARRCDCGSPDVARVGKPVCPDCKKEKRDPDKSRARERRRTLRRYGLTEAEWNRLLASQDGRCAICRTDSPGDKGERWHIDHCHSTGRVRGLLCHSCNTSLGHFHDDPDCLVAALRYLGYEVKGLVWAQSELKVVD